MNSNSGQEIPSSARPLLHHHGGHGLHHHYQRHHHHHHHHHHHYHYHFHFFYIFLHCPLHRPILIPNIHSHLCSFSTAYPTLQNPEPVPYIPPEPYSNFQDTQRNETFDESQMIEEGIEELELEEEEEEEEPIFVLTDEWREFFSKSEAKRRLAKTQARKREK